MRLGIQHVLPHTSPEEWAEQLQSLGLRAASFPVDYKTSVSVVDAYVREAKARDILIGEVGVWDSPFSPDPQAAQKAQRACVESLRLADYIGARCCVNVSGAFGPKWAGCYEENFSEAAYEKNLTFIRRLLEEVKPTHTSYSLEPMPWMVPRTPEEALQIIRDIGHPHFKAHMDICNFVSDAETFVHADALIHRSFDLLGEEIVSCHLKDLILEDLYTVHVTEVIPGEGRMNLPLYLERIEELEDPDMPVFIEHLKTREDYEMALRYVRSIYDFDQEA